MMVSSLLVMLQVSPHHCSKEVHTLPYGLVEAAHVLSKAMKKGDLSAKALAPYEQAEIDLLPISQDIEREGCVVQPFG